MTATEPSCLREQLALAGGRMADRWTMWGPREEIGLYKGKISKEVKGAGKTWAAHWVRMEEECGRDERWRRDIVRLRW